MVSKIKISVLRPNANTGWSRPGQVTLATNTPCVTPYTIFTLVSQRFGTRRGAWKCSYWQNHIFHWNANTGIWTLIKWYGTSRPRVTVTVTRYLPRVRECNLWIGRTRHYSSPEIYSWTHIVFKINSFGKTWLRRRDSNPDVSLNAMGIEGEYVVCSSARYIRIGKWGGIVWGMKGCVRYEVWRRNYCTALHLDDMCQYTRSRNRTDERAWNWTWRTYQKNIH
jgi:hypothetical protein